MKLEHFCEELLDSEDLTEEFLLEKLLRREDLELEEVFWEILLIRDDFEELL